MNKDERQELANEIEDLQQRIAELTEQLARTMRECSDISYTAEVVETNIYSMLGVNGYYNVHSNVDSSLEYLKDDSNFEDELTVISAKGHDVVLGIIHSEDDMAHAANVYRKTTGVSVSQSIIAVRAIRDNAFKIENEQLDYYLPNFMGGDELQELAEISAIYYLTNEVQPGMQYTKIPAIKAWREVTHDSLRDAKSAIEDIMEWL